MIDLSRCNYNNTNNCTGGSSPDSASVAITDVDPTNWLRECVQPYQSHWPAGGGHYLGYWSNYYQIGMKSGLCADALSCAFERCEWTDQAQKVLSSADSTTTFGDIATNLPALNLPDQIGFPDSVAQLVELVKYAESHGKRVTVKTSGHSYVGASTAKGSVQANLRNFPKYSHESITQCNSETLGIHAASCKLALARGKTAVARVGGGEVFDELYRAVIDWNSR